LSSITGLIILQADLVQQVKLLLGSVIAGALLFLPSPDLNTLSTNGWDGSLCCDARQ